MKPLLFKRLAESLIEGEGAGMTALYSGVGVCALTALQAVCVPHLVYITQRTEIRIQTSLAGLVYRKVIAIVVFLMYYEACLPLYIMMYININDYIWI